ncbi:hypothetical protein CIB48_g9915 [Xylaria polymorpha]|nr:hypothetical protein CIB48_g9915 [Xylaria polymorpha]
MAGLATSDRLYMIYGMNALACTQLATDTNSLLCNTSPATSSKRPSPSPVTQDSEGKKARLLSYEEASPGKNLDRELPQATNEFHQISQQLYETETQDISGNKVNDGFYNGDPNTSLNLLAYRDQVLPSTLYPPPDQDNISPGSNYFPEDQVQTGLFKETLPFMGFGSVDDLLKHDSDQHIAGNTGVLYGTNASQHGYSVPIRSQANEATAISLTATVAEKSIEICINYDTCFGVHDKETAGRLLSDAGIFLQHPSAAEMIPEVRYDNPHYLVRPGTEMPILEQLHLDDITDNTENKLLNETRKGCFIQILETAKADGESDVCLGKTLSMSSLICTSLDFDSRTNNQDRGVRHQGTLIIAATSSKFDVEKYDLYESLICTNISTVFMTRSTKFGQFGE